MIKFKIDMGADLYVIPSTTYDGLLHHTKMPLVGPRQNELKVCGWFEATLERHILHSVDHVLAQIGDTKFFSKLDANSGFWQIELSPDLSKLTTFITPFQSLIVYHLVFPQHPNLFQKMLEILSEK